MHMAIALFLLFFLAGAPRPGSDFKVSVLDVAAQYRCLAPELCDSVLLAVTVTNSTTEPVTGCFTADLTWLYEPSDSLRQAFAARLDSMGRSAADVCRWHPVSYRLGGSQPGATFHCRKASLEPGQSFSETLTAQTHALDFVNYPGILDATVTIWAGEKGASWDSAKVVGACKLAIKVPR
jgi:hypothetical protein